MNPVTAWKHHRDAVRTRRHHAREFHRLLAQADTLHEVRAAAREIPPGPRLTAAALAARATGIGAGTITRVAMTEAVETILDADPSNAQHEDQVLALTVNAVCRIAAA
jgi:hypothetical protein